MVSLFEGIGNAVRNLYCATALPLATGVSILGNVYRGLGGEEQGDDLLASAQLIRGAQQVACNRPPDDVSGAITPPFEGGQCMGVQYQVTSSFRNIIYLNGQIFNEVTTNNVSTGPGPISYESSNIQPPNGLVSVTLRYSNGNIAANGSISGGGANETFEVQVITLDVVRVDGLPDDCGSLPPIPPEYNPEDWTFNPTINYDDDNGNPLTIDPTIVLGPNTLGPGGGIQVPVTVTFSPGIEIHGDFNLNTGDFTIGGGDGADGGGIDGPQELGPDEPVEEGIDEVIGVRVISTRLSNADETTQIGQNGGNPDIYVPRVGNVAFKYSTGNSSLGWGRDIPVKGLNYVIWADRVALDVAATAADGWSLSLRKIIKKKTSCCE